MYQVASSFDKFEGFIKGIIKKKQETLLGGATSDAEGTHDLLDLMLRSHDADSGFKMSDQQLLHNVNVFFLAGACQVTKLKNRKFDRSRRPLGHETSSAALVMTLHLLSIHEEVQKKVQEELDQVLGGRYATYDDLKEVLTFLK